MRREPLFTQGVRKPQGKSSGDVTIGQSHVALWGSMECDENLGKAGTTTPECCRDTALVSPGIPHLSYEEPVEVRGGNLELIQQDKLQGPLHRVCLETQKYS